MRRFYILVHQHGEYTAFCPRQFGAILLHVCEEEKALLRLNHGLHMSKASAHGGLSRSGVCGAAGENCGGTAARSGHVNPNLCLEGDQLVSSCASSGHGRAPRPA